LIEQKKQLQSLKKHEKGKNSSVIKEVPDVGQKTVNMKIHNDRKFDPSKTSIQDSWFQSKEKSGHSSISVRPSMAVPVFAESIPDT